MNLNDQAYPTIRKLVGSEQYAHLPAGCAFSSEDRITEVVIPGFTKLEVASLMMAQALLTNGNANSVSKDAVKWAKAVLGECNKNV